MHGIKPVCSLVRRSRVRRATRCRSLRRQRDGAPNGSGSSGGGSRCGSRASCLKLESGSHLVPLVQTCLGVAVRRPVGARRLFVAYVTPGSSRGEFQRQPAVCSGETWHPLRGKEGKMAPKRREGHAPAVGAVLLVVGRVELKHRAGVSRVRIINQGVVADHSCTSGMERELKSSRVSQISRANTVFSAFPRRGGREARHRGIAE